MSKGKQEPETTYAGLMEAVTEGHVSADELLAEIEKHPEWLAEGDVADATMAKYQKMAKAGKLPVGKKEKSEKKAEKPAPKKEAQPEPETPLVTDQSIALAGSTFESLVDEACGAMRKKKSKKSKKKESIHEFAAPERQDVIMWARGNAPKRTEPKNPFYFQEAQMFSRKKLIAERNLDEKTARVLHPNRLDASSGRHAVLAQKGLRFAGYKVEFVDEL